MKALWTPEQILNALVAVWNDYSETGRRRKTGAIGLCLDGSSYYIVIRPERITLEKQTSLKVVVSLACSLEDFLSLLRSRWFLLRGVMSRRLLFKGDVTFFRVLPRVDFGRYLCDGKDRGEDFEKFPHRQWKIPGRILVLCASPRAEEGYTRFLAEYFLRGMKKVCDRVEVVELARLEIQPCCGCWYCWRAGNGRCILDGRDDCRGLLEAMDASDLIVFAFPLYSDGVPAGLKNLFDRRVVTLEPFMIPGWRKTRHPRRTMKRQAMAVLSGCGFIEKEHFRAVREHFRALSHNWHVPVAGEIYRPGVISLFNNPLFFSYQQKVLAGLEEAGEMLVREGRISWWLRKKIERNFTSVRNFRGSANYFWTKHENDEAGMIY